MERLKIPPGGNQFIEAVIKGFRPERIGAE
jgi:hypothetical protein